MKRIAITQRIIFSDKGADKDALDQDYVTYYEKFGIILLPMPNVLSNVSKYLDSLKLDGIILSGGNDINPKMYGEKSAENEKYADARDRTEKEVLDYAIKNKIPVFCECRGCQFLNVYFGGKIIKLQDHVKPLGHNIVMTSTPKISFKEKKQIANSYHNWGFKDKQLAKKLIPFAYSEDGIIEGIYHPDYPIAGIMWHPERNSSNASFNDVLINSFLNKERFWKS